MAEEIGQLFYYVTGIIILTALLRFTWSISGELAKYAMTRIWPPKSITIQRGYAGSQCFEYIRDDWGRVAWVNRLPENDREANDEP